MKNYRIYGKFKAKSPISHISEAESTTSFLVQEPIMQDDGTIEEVFCYNGNAFRGQLRDLCASYLLDKLQVTVPLDIFHLLFSGGKIGGDQSIDIAQARLMRQVVPMVSLFGGGVGNQIMQGKLKVGNSYALCNEAMPVIAQRYHEQASKIDYADLTFEKSFTRFDDAKDLEKQSRVVGDDLPKLEGKPKKGDVSTQMRMTSELLVAGATLVHEIDLCQVTEVELGAFVSALSLFAQMPYIGGQSNKGHGRVDYVSKIVDMATGEEVNFVCVNDNFLKLGETAEEAKAQYDEHLLKLYQSFLENNAPEATKLLGATCTTQN